MVSVYSNIKLSAVKHAKVIVLLLNSADFKKNSITSNMKKILIKPQRLHCIVHSGIAGQFTLKTSFSRKSAIIKSQYWQNCNETVGRE